MSRIPDVGNPWLDAGIVPFSTLSYRAEPDYFAKWFPADWVSESFPGQFRNWFYSLLAMGTVMAETAPFKELFGYALLFAEDGREMHKSWGNAIEFNEAADKMGVDIMRWVYCNHKPENNLLFGYERADEARRAILIPLWNVYSFFVTYAKLDGWTPSWSDFDPDHPEGPTPDSDNPLDKWILARLNQVARRVTTSLNDTDAFAATLAIAPLVDDLTNWYVRRSRRRFWRSEQDADKNAAYATLYHVLVKLVRLLAPFMPFVTEEIYQNLVVSQFDQQGSSAQTNSEKKALVRSSVHQTLWPATDEKAIDDALITEMGLARQIASLGLSARGNAGLKVRQPLSKILVHSPSLDKLPQALVEILTDELNVKQLAFVPDPSSLVAYSLLPDNAALGPRFGADFPKLRAALAKLDPAAAKAQLDAGEPITLKMGKEKVQLAPEEILVNSAPAEGLAVAVEKGLTVAIDATLTPELKAEGLAREYVRHIQDTRKKAGLNIEDRIITASGVKSEELRKVLADFADYIKTETLSTELLLEEPSEEFFVVENNLGGEKAPLGVKKA